MPIDDHLGELESKPKTEKKLTPEEINAIRRFKEEVTISLEQVLKIVEKLQEKNIDELIFEVINKEHEEGKSFSYSTKSQSSEGIEIIFKRFIFTPYGTSKYNSIYNYSIKIITPLYTGSGIISHQDQDLNLTDAYWKLDKIFTEMENIYEERHSRIKGLIINEIDSAIENL